MLQTKVGMFALQIVGASQAITGVGFMPKLLIFQCTKETNNDTTHGEFNAALSFGAVDSSLNHRLIYHNQLATFYPRGTVPATEVIYSLMDNVNAIKTLNWPPAFTVESAAKVASMDADGFTLSITTNPPSGYFVGYWALGGDSIQQVKVGTFSSPTVTGPQTVTGLGFKPDLLFLFSQLTPNDNSLVTSEFHHCFGMGNAYNQFACGSVGQKVSTTNKYNATFADAGYIFLGCADLDGHTSPDMQATLTSLDLDGFTLNWPVTIASSTAIGYIAVKAGIEQAMDTVLLPKLTGNFNISTPFKPKALFMAGPNVLALDHTVLEADHSQVCYGYADTGLNDDYSASANCGSAVAGGDVGYTARTNSGTIRNTVLCPAGIDPVTSWAWANGVGISLWKKDGMTLSHKVGLPKQYYQAYLALGEIGGGFNGQII
jgi:hypothetical protein